MASYNRQQGSYSPPRRPDRMDMNPPVPPRREDLSHHEQRESFLPEVPIRTDIHSQQSSPSTRGAVADSASDGIRKVKINLHFDNERECTYITSSLSTWERQSGILLLVSQYRMNK